MSDKTREIVLSPESITAIAQEAGAMVVNQLLLDDKIKIAPDQMDRLAEKVASLMDATVDYSKIRPAEEKKLFPEQIKSLKADFSTQLSNLDSSLFSKITSAGRDTYKITAQERADIAREALSGLDLPEETMTMLTRSFVSKTFFNKKIGLLLSFVEKNRGKVINAGISGKDMVEEINKVLGTDWQTGGEDGDMLKSVYDTNDDGKVGAADIADAADSVPWTGVTGKPPIGDVVGPGSSDNNQLARADGGTGKAIKYSLVVIDDNRNLTQIKDLESDGDFYLKEGMTVFWTVTGKQSSAEVGSIKIDSFGNVTFKTNNNNALQLSDFVGTLVSKDLTVVGSVRLKGAVTRGRVGSGGDYISTALTDHYLIAITDTSAPRLVSISTADIQVGNFNDVRYFEIKDEGGQAGTNVITISGQTGNVDGGANVTISANYGALKLYADGVNLFTKK